MVDLKVPIHLTNIRVVSESELTTEFIDVVIPAHGDAQHLEAFSTSPTSWLIQGDILLTGREDRAKIILQSQDGRHRGSTHVQLELGEIKGEEIHFDFDMQTQHSPRLSLRANMTLSNGTPVTLSSLLDIGTDYLETFEHSRNTKELEQAITHLQLAVEVADAGHPDLPACFSNLGVAYAEMFRKTGDLDDADSAISNHKKGVGITPLDDPELPMRLKNLGYTYCERFEKAGDVNDLSSAISSQQRAIELVSSNNPDTSSWLNDLAGLYSDRFHLIGNLSDLDFAISNLVKVIDLTSPDDEDLPRTFNNLGASYFNRFKRTDDVCDIVSAISYLERSVEATPAGHQGFPECLDKLGCCYYERFKRIGEFKDLTKAISTQEKALSITPEDHLELATILTGLGNSYGTLFAQTEDLNDIEIAISTQLKVMDITPRNHPEFPNRLSNLGLSYSHRFARTGDLEDLVLALSSQEEVVSITPPGHPDRSNWLNSLGKSYSQRYMRLGELDDIALAISNFEDAAQTARRDDPNLASILSNLGNAYSMRSEKGRELEDIERAISSQQQAVDLTPPNHPELSVRLSNLGLSHYGRYGQTGHLDDLDRAISTQQKAVEGALSSHPTFPRMLNNLGNLYSDRLRRTGDLGDIELCISCLRKAVDATPEDHPDLSQMLDNLGSAHADRFEKTGELRDVGRAIECLEKAVGLTPRGHPRLAGLLDHLGSSYSLRLGKTGNLVDLELGILNHEKAVEATPDGHPSLPKRLNNLGSSYVARFEQTADAEDIERAIEKHQRAVALTPIRHPDLSNLLNNLADSIFARFQITSERGDVETVLSLLRQGADTNSAPSWRFRLARKAAGLSFDYDPPRCIDDCTSAMDLLSQLVGFDQILQHRHHHLRGASDFTSFATAAAITHDRVDLAVKWLEQGRCLVWNQIGQLRSPVEELRFEYPELADELEGVAKALDLLGSRAASSGMLVEDVSIEAQISLQDEASRHSACANKYNSLLERIRKEDGFEAFLLPAPIEDLIAALPPEGPVVVLNVHEIRSDALVLQRGIEPILVHLDISDADAQKMSANLRRNLRDIGDERFGKGSGAKRSKPVPVDTLVVLWKKIIDPVFSALGYFKSSISLADRPRLWWCPTGSLAFLPLHATHSTVVEGKPTQSASDFVISSYIPTISSLVTKYNSSSASSCTGVAVISQPYAPGNSPIPSARIEARELKMLTDKAHVSNTLIEDGEATIGAVMKQMGTHSWLHFACHGVQDDADPLSSGLILQDGRLKLSDIIRQRLPHPDFAFLCACQTGKGDTELSNEVVHLSAGMLTIGYRSVIGTMWSIADEHGPAIASDTYTYLIQQGMVSSEAARALDYATRKFRERFGYGDIYSAWIPYVHFGY